MTDLVLSTKWVNRIECSFADRPDSTNGDSVLPYCQQNGSAVQNVVSVIDPLQQIMTLKIGETTNYTAGSSIHINKFVDQQYGSTTQIVVSAPTSTNGVIPNRQNWYGELYALRCSVRGGGTVQSVDRSAQGHTRTRWSPPWLEKTTNTGVGL